MKQVSIGKMKKFKSLKNVEIAKSTSEMSKEDYDFERACETIFHM